MAFFLHGSYEPPIPQRLEIRDLLILGGAQIIKRQNTRKTGIPLVDPEWSAATDRSELPLSTFGVKPVNAIWVLDCISSYSVLGTKDYSL
jgi:hypothetical protein